MEWKEKFNLLQPVDGKLEAKAVKRPLQESGLSKEVLKR